MKTTRCFDHVRQRPDRAIIRDERIKRARGNPEHEVIQAERRLRRWATIEAMDL